MEHGEGAHAGVQGAVVQGGGASAVMEEGLEQDPPFLKDDGSPVSLRDVRLVEQEEAREHGGHVPKGGFTGAVQRVAEANWLAGFTPEPTPQECAAAIHRYQPGAELPTPDTAHEIQAAEQQRLGHNPKHGLGSKVLSAATRADLAMRKAVEAGGFTEESAALLQAAESKLYGHTLPGGLASQVSSFAEKNREAGLFSEYHANPKRWAQAPPAGTAGGAGTAGTAAGGAGAAGDGVAAGGGRAEAAG